MTNGYEQLVRAARALTHTEVLDAEDIPIDAATQSFLRTNAPALDAARQALQLPCSIPLEFEVSFFQAHVGDASPLRDLARSFSLEARVAEQCGEPSRAMRVGLNILELGNAMRRGGLLVDALTAVTVEAIGINRLRSLRRWLNVADSLFLASELLRVDSAREPLDDVLARDARWTKAVGWDKDSDAGVGNREFPALDETPLDEQAKQAIMDLLQFLAALPREDLQAMERLGDDFNLAILRLLAIECALNAYGRQHGEEPSDLAQLAPEFIARLPLDPFTAGPFKYRRECDLARSSDSAPRFRRFLRRIGDCFARSRGKTAALCRGYRLYSPGPVGRDLGGTYGHRIEVFCGKADLCVDVFDYQVTVAEEP